MFEICISVLNLVFSEPIVSFQYFETHFFLSLEKIEFVQRGGVDIYSYSIRISRARGLRGLPRGELRGRAGERGLAAPGGAAAAAPRALRAVPDERGARRAAAVGRGVRRPLREICRIPAAFDCIGTDQHLFRDPGVWTSRVFRCLVF